MNRSHVDAGWPVEKFPVSSFHLPGLWEFKQPAPEIPIGALLCGVPLDWAGCALELGAATLNLSSEFVDPRLIADADAHAHAHAHGIKVCVYTVS